MMHLRGERKYKKDKNVTAKKTGAKLLNSILILKSKLANSIRIDIDYPLESVQICCVPCFC